MDLKTTGVKFTPKLLNGFEMLEKIADVIRDPVLRDWFADIAVDGTCSQLLDLSDTGVTDGYMGSNCFNDGPAPGTRRLFQSSGPLTVRSLRATLERKIGRAALAEIWSTVSQYHGSPDAKMFLGDLDLFATGEKSKTRQSRTPGELSGILEEVKRSLETWLVNGRSEGELAPAERNLLRRLRITSLSVEPAPSGNGALLQLSDRPVIRLSPEVSESNTAELKLVLAHELSHHFDPSSS